MRRTSRSTKVLTALAVLGVLAIGWLLATPTSMAFYRSGGPHFGELDIICAPVLFEPHRPYERSADQEQYRDGNVLREKPASKQTLSACRELRTQTVGWSVLLAIPTTVLVTVAILRHRDETPAEHISHDQAVAIAG